MSMHLPSRTRMRKLGIRPLLAVAVLLFLVVLPTWGNEGVLNFIIVLCYYVALAQMWNLLAGYAGLISIGQQVFIGLGGYTLAVLAERAGLDVWLALPLAGLVTAALAIPIGTLSFRLYGGYFAVGTWVMAEIFRLAFGNWGFVGLAVGMFIRSARIVSLQTVYYVAVAIAVGAVTVLFLLLRSRIGLGLTTIRDSEEAAASLGVDVYRTKMLCFVISACGTGLAAALLYIYTPFIQPNEAFSVNWSAAMIFAVVVGGIGTVEGPIVGAVLYVLLQQQLTQYGVMSLIILGAISILTMLLAPRGIIGMLRLRFGIELFSVTRQLSADAVVVGPVSIGPATVASGAQGGTVGQSDHL